MQYKSPETPQKVAAMLQLILKAPHGVFLQLLSRGLGAFLLLLPG